MSKEDWGYIGAFFAVLSALLFVINFFTHETCVERDIVKNIGGCNSDGMCKVVFENGKSRIINYPIVGELRCSEME